MLKASVGILAHGGEGSGGENREEEKSRGEERQRLSESNPKSLPSCASSQVAFWKAKKQMLIATQSPTYLLHVGSLKGVWRGVHPQRKVGVGGGGEYVSTHLDISCQ